MINNYVKSKSIRKDDLYVSSGEKLYVIGSQDGLFPSFGRHSINEMGGIWAHPIKLMDGFWLSITEDNKKQWLNKANSISVHPHTTEFIYELENFKVKREQFVPLKQTALVVKYTFYNKTSTPKSLTIDFLAKTELICSWGSEEMGLYNDEDECWFDDKNNVLVGKDKSNPYYVVWGTNQTIKNIEIGKDIYCIENTKGNGIKGVITSEITIDKEITISYTISGSHISLDNALKEYNLVANNYDKLYQEKINHFEGVLNQSALTIPDETIKTVYDVTKINTQWLIRDVDGIGRGIGAGLPDYPWWFGCDNGYSVPALLTMGEFELAKSTLRILKHFSEKINGNGRIVHEISTNGFVFNIGNTQETPHFINTIWTVYQWTGDIEFLSEMYDLCKSGITWLLEESDCDKDLFPEGYGIMEIAGLNAELIDTAVYTAEALKTISNMANVFGETELANKYIDLHKSAVASIEKRFWVEEEGLYGDVISTPEAVKEAFPIFAKRHDEIIGGHYNHRMAKLDRLYDTLDNYEKGKEYVWSIFKNWVILTPLEMGYTEKEKALKVLDTMSTEEFMSDYGLYIEALGRIYAMTISTAVLAVCEAVYGRKENCVKYIHTIAKSMDKVMPLSIAELSPESGCFVQEWTIYGTVYPVVRYLFGIDPQADKKKVVISPQMLDEWNNASLKNVRIGNGSIDIDFKRVNGEEKITVIKNNLDWEIEVKKA